MIPKYLLSALTAASGPTSSGNYFFASAYSACPQDRYNATGSYTRFTCRAEHVIGSADRAKLKVALPNWGLTNTNNLPAKFDFVWMECNGVSVPVTFSSSRSITLAAGLSIQLSDEILPSSFGLSKFTRGTQFWLNFDGPAVSATNRFILSARYNPSAGCSLYQYNSATTTPNTDGLGARSFTGGVLNTDYAVFNTNNMTEIAHGVVGTFVGADQPVWAILSDSIGAGVGDTSGAILGTNVGGWFQRGMFDVDLVSNPMANMKLAVAGAQAAQFVTRATEMGVWCGYANRAIDGLGTNDFAASGTAVTLATMQGYAQSVWTAAKSAGTVSKLWRHDLLVRVTSTDNYQTEANQTVTGTGWGSGGNVQQFNTWIGTQVGTNINGELRFTNPYGTDTTKWFANGTAFYATPDGLHPNQAMHILMAAQWRSLRQSIA